MIHATKYPKPIAANAYTGRTTKAKAAVDEPDAKYEYVKVIYVANMNRAGSRITNLLVCFLERKK